MDTRQPAEKNVKAEIDEIKRFMPKTYQAIQDRATDTGNEAYALVRRGLRGEPGCFYAMERGYVKGAPFRGNAIEATVAQQMVTFGVDFVVVWPPVVEVSHGAH